MKVTNDVVQAVSKAFSEVEGLLPMKYCQFESLVAEKLKENLSPFYEKCSIERMYTITPEEEVDLDRAGIGGLKVEMWNEKMHFKISCRKGKDEMDFFAVARATLMRLYKHRLLGEAPKWRDEVTEETIVPVIHEYWVEKKDGGWIEK
jgi:hypothetical protein